MLPTGDSDTLGGFVFDLFGKIPIINEKVLYEGIEFIVQRMEGRNRHARRANSILYRNRIDRSKSQEEYQQPLLIAL